MSVRFVQYRDADEVFRANFAAEKMVNEKLQKQISDEVPAPLSSRKNAPQAYQNTNTGYTKKLSRQDSSLNASLNLSGTSMLLTRK